MTTIELTSVPRVLKDAMDSAQSEAVLLRTPDGMEFLLAPVDDFDLEVAKTRANEELMQFLEQRAREPATIPIEEIEARLRDE